MMMMIFGQFPPRMLISAIILLLSKFNAKIEISLGYLGYFLVHSAFW